MKISRRSFLKSSAATTVAMSIPGGIAANILADQPLVPGPGNKWPGRVVINFNKAAISGKTTAVPAVIQKMVDDNILCLSGEKTIAAAWKSIFPASLTGQSKVTIKVFAANASVPTHWSSVKAITDGLMMMDFNGTKFPAANITIYEGNASNQLTKAGFTTENFPGIKLEYWDRTSNKFVDAEGNDAAGEVNKRGYSGSLKNADFLINVFNTRGHNLGSTFTLGFKGHFGTFDLASPTDLHTNTALHLRDMNCTGPVFKKTVLSVCAAIYGMNEGNGPTGSMDDYSKYTKTMDSTSTCACPATIIMSTDPVSCEMQAVKTMRLNNKDDKKAKYGIADMPPYLQASAGITGALKGTIYNIGIIDESKMDIRRIINDATAINNPRTLSRSQTATNIAISRVHNHNCTFIEYVLPANNIDKKVSIAIYSLDGTLIQKLSKTSLGIFNHYSWDHLDRAGNQVQAGKYVVKITSGTVSLAADFVVNR